MITPITETAKLMYFKRYDNMLVQNSPSESLLRKVDKQCFIGYELPMLRVWEVLSEVVNTKLYEFKQQETE